MGGLNRRPAYEVRFASKRVVKELAAVDAHTGESIAAALQGLRTNPRPRTSRKLQGSSDLYRIRLGAYRIIYHLDDSSRTVVVTRIARRADSTYRQR